MRLSCTALLLLCSSLITTTFAWVAPATFKNRVSTRLAAGAQLPPSSRRQWLSHAVAAAGVALTAPTTAAATTTLKKPTTRIVSSPAVCDTAVTAWKNPNNGRTVYLLGTAHISSQSADVAGKLVDDVQPDAVFVELDAKRVGRAGSIIAPSPENARDASQSSETMVPAAPLRASMETQSQQEAPPPPQQQPRSSLIPKLDIRQRALQAGSAAVGSAIKGMYSKLNSSGFSAGEEFVVAVREGRKVGASIVLGDRDVEVTLRRLTEALAETDLKELMNPDSELEKSMSELLPGKPPSPDMGDDEFRQEMSTYVETMKAKDNVRKIMKELKKSAPAIYKALVEERDIYMAQGLDSLNQFPTTVAVMGIAHMEGVEETLQRLGWQQAPVKCPKI